MRKAFTLIELLAVITVLAIILLITIPKVLDTISSSKKDAFIASTQLLAKAGAKYLAENWNDITKPVNGAGLVVTAQQLKTAGYIKNISGISNSVVTIYNNNGTYEVHVFATNGSYIVDGYTNDYIKSNVRPGSTDYDSLITSSSTYCSSGSKLSLSTLDTSCASAPELASNMIPIYYDSANSVWKKADVTNLNSTYKWYDYTNKIWANAVTVTDATRTTYQNAAVGTTILEADILTYMVWIPRYKYAIPIGTGARSISIVFENSSTTKSTGTAIETSYYTHPAFTFGTKELNGIWFSKFELTGTVSAITVKPGFPSISVSKFATLFIAIRNMENNGNSYGYIASEVDTHMMLATDWGAVAYLSYSIYGINSEIYKNNSSSRYTGRSGGNVGGSQILNGTYEYINTGYYKYNGKCATTTTLVPGIDANCTAVGNTVSDLNLSYKASTTGTIYGIYDMSGGWWEYVMGTFNKYSGYSLTENSGFNGPTGSDSGTYSTGINFPEAKYYNLFTTSALATACNGSPCTGYALGETALWNNDNGSTTVTSLSITYPWMVKGYTYAAKTEAGVFATTAASGATWTTRAIVTIE